VELVNDLGVEQGIFLGHTDPVRRAVPTAVVFDRSEEAQSLDGSEVLQVTEYLMVGKVRDFIGAAVVLILEVGIIDTPLEAGQQLPRQAQFHPVEVDIPDILVLIDNFPGIVGVRNHFEKNEIADVAIEKIRFHGESLKEEILVPDLVVNGFFRFQIRVGPRSAELVRVLVFHGRESGFCAILAWSVPVSVSR